MANWNSNLLEVEGPQKDIDRMKKAVKGKESVFDFEKILPTPKELLASGSPQQDEATGKKFKDKYGATDWYVWRVKNWGTKWDLDPNGLDWYGNTLVFDSAWSPPASIIRFISEQYPTLIFKLEYCEPCMSFAGNVEFKAGKTIVDDFTEDTHSELFKKCFQDLCGDWEQMFEGQE
ncbi:hypothetical protein ACFLQL_04185 [Verrucomicrobiota bacterium]